MKNDYCLDNWTGQIFNQDDLFWGLDTQLEPLFEVGYGNVLYISGWCFHRTHQIKNLRIILNKVSYEMLHINIIRSDIFKIFFKKDLSNKNCEQCGFWCVVPIGKLSEPISTKVTLEIAFDKGNKRSVVLGETILSPRDTPNKNLEDFRKIAYETVLKIRKSKSTPHVMICLATYNPNKDLFQNQIHSIKNQTYQNWSCIINDDCSELLSYEWIREFIGDDERFILIRNLQNIGFYKNFEKLLNLVPENVDFVALSDQDDYWFKNKIERLAKEFDEDTTLVYSDMNIVDRNGKIISNTFWTTRKNYYEDLDYLVLVNTITGAASMFRNSIVNYLLPFPASIGTSYHDHWIGCVANALGEIKYINESLYDYYQHGDNILGQATFPKKSLCHGVKFIKNFPDKRKIKNTLVFYQCVFNIDGVRSIIISLNLLLRIPNMNKEKRKKLQKFRTLAESSIGIFAMAVKTKLNKKTTCNAERYIFKAYWADKIIRSKILKFF
jgi:glycosyltransferase involved in cell wall biosynthesis